MNYRNLEITRGIPTPIVFEILDDTGLKVNLVGHTFKFEVFDSNNKLVFTDNVPTFVDLGSIEFSINAAESVIFKDPLYTYRFVVINPSLVPKLYYKGYLSSGSIIFDVSTTPDTTQVALPDGTIYPNGPLTVTPDVWYALVSNYRFLVSGYGVVVIDGKDIHGSVWGNLELYESNTFEESIWTPQPSLYGMISFRIKQAIGTNTIKYLP